MTFRSKLGVGMRQSHDLALVAIDFLFAPDIGANNIAVHVR
jgi:hypothetical protein